MELKQIKELMSAMQRTGTKRISIKREGVEIELEREDRFDNAIDYALDYAEENPMLRQEMALQRANVMFSHPTEKPVTAIKVADSPEKPGTYITSPMVGTFYSTPSPDDPAFVKMGGKVEKESVVCIIEAMKVMNEVKAGTAGTIAEILIENGQPVEFGTKLFRIV